MKWIYTLLVLVGMLAGCEVDCSDPEAPTWSCGFGDSEAAEELGTGGATSEGRQTVHMPFEVGSTHLCTQGAGGSFSHSDTTTRYALDFDVPNDPNNRTRLYAPWGGVVYTFNDAQNFGRHVNIDIGGGVFVVLAHMESIAVQSGTLVETGDYLGLAGNTGSSSGDHVHIGLQRGDPTRNAIYSVSEPANVFSLDATAPAGARPYSTENYVCGLSNGHWYESQLPRSNPNTGGGNDGGSGATSDNAVLTVTWRVPAGGPAEELHMGGDLVSVSGSTVLPWSWSQRENATQISRSMGVASGDRFRFSVTWVRDGATLWSCMGNPPVLTGTTDAQLDNGQQLQAQITDAPTSDGCELTITVP